MVRGNSAWAAHWRSAHFDCSRDYLRLERLLAIPSIVLATCILGFAFYAVDRPGAPLWTQYALAGLTVIQGVLAAVLAYLRPSAMAEHYRSAAVNFASVSRRWGEIELRLMLQERPSSDELADILRSSDQAAREALPVTRRVLKSRGEAPPYASFGHWT